MSSIRRSRSREEVWFGKKFANVVTYFTLTNTNAEMDRKECLQNRILSLIRKHKDSKLFWYPATMHVALLTGMKKKCPTYNEWLCRLWRRCQGRATGVLPWLFSDLRLSDCWHVDQMRWKNAQRTDQRTFQLANICEFQVGIIKVPEYFFSYKILSKASQCGMCFCSPNSLKSPALWHLSNVVDVSI